MSRHEPVGRRARVDDDRRAAAPDDAGGPADGRSCSRRRAAHRRRHVPLAVAAPRRDLRHPGVPAAGAVRHPPPHLQRPGFYIDNARATLWEASSASSIALVLALVGGHGHGPLPVLEQASLPLAVLIQVTPIIAYAPAIVIWLGFGLKPILVITSLVCFVPFLVNAVTGFRSVDPNLLELARSVDAAGARSSSGCACRRRCPTSSRPHGSRSASRSSAQCSASSSPASRSGLGYAVKVAQNRNLPSAVGPRSTCSLPRRRGVILIRCSSGSSCTGTPASALTHRSPPSKQQREPTREGAT